MSVCLMYCQRMKTTKTINIKNKTIMRQLKFIIILLSLIIGSANVNATSYISGEMITIMDSDGTLSTDMTCTRFDIMDNSTLTINQGVTLTLNCQRFTFMDSSTIELHGTLTGSAGSDVTWIYRSYINVYLSDGAKYTVTGLSCMDGDNYLVYYGYDAATDGNGTVSVKNGSTDVTSTSKGYKTTTYTFTATPNDGYKFVNWTKGAGGEVLGTDASINVTCEQNGQYQVYANFEADAPAAINITANSDGAATPTYWATYYNGSTSYTADENTTVYQAAVNTAKTGVTLTEVSGREIPAGKAVILKSTAESITLTPASTTQTLDGNELQGVDAATDAPSNAYCLSKEATRGVGFYTFTGNIPAHRAYLVVADGPSNARGFLGFGDDDNTTGISLPEAVVVEDNGAIYDLSGRRVTGQPQKGIYVKNGKKFVIK